MGIEAAAPEREPHAKQRASVGEGILGRVGAADERQYAPLRLEETRCGRAEDAMET
jgi:hypothetical protein